MLKRNFLIFCFLFSSGGILSGAEILFKNGDAFLVEEFQETGNYITISWKDKKYRIPRSDLQRIDPRKKGPATSYRYLEFQLSDGTVLRGILVDRKESKLILKTELGFAELDTSKIVSQTGDTKDSPPELPEEYLTNETFGAEWRLGILGQASGAWGPWRSSFPVSYGAGFFLERSSSHPGRFYGFLSEISESPGKSGQLSVWTQQFYLGKSYGTSAPYWILGLGGSSFHRTQGEDRTAAWTPDTSLEFGWAWQTASKHQIRIGIRNICHWSGDSTLCQTGLKFSWGMAL
ncbi:LA_3334 family protein [Leptospira wolffii]|uniref:LA_3334 family protein n=1 Tax=Leptospira wolffii TaxID=409998 RepID=A0ABV5BQX0_9LEPT